MKSLFRSIALLGVLAASGAVYAQPNQNTQPPQQVNWNDELRQAQEENRALKNIFAAIESIDTARQNELVQWVITDRSVRSRVISALRKSGKDISANSNADLYITQKPASITEGQVNTDVELLRIVVESVGIYGTPTIKKILGEDLYNKINNRTGYEYSLISTQPAQDKIQYLNIDAAIWGGHMILKSGFGINIGLGQDYIGYPFWLPGNVDISGLLIKEKTHLKIGLNFPIGDAGINSFDISGGFQIKERKLEGTQAFNASIEQAIDVIDNPKQSGAISLGGEIYNSFTPSITTLSSHAYYPQYRTDYVNNQIPGTAKDSMFYIGMSGHGWLTYHFGEVLKGLYVQAGAGTHSINAITIGAHGTTNKPNDPNYNEVVLQKTYSYFDPLVKVGYVYSNNSGDQWGMSLQYCNTLFAYGFIRLFSWLDLEAKYSVVVGRDPRKWEWSDFVIVSPVLHLNF
jgi:hypothetical protein